MTAVLTNEVIKLFYKKSSWIMLGLLPIFALIVAFFEKYLNTFGGSAPVYANDLTQTLFNGLLPSLCTLFVVVVTSSIVAEEFTRDTAKQLLTRPFSRHAILFSKFCVSFIYAIVVNLVMLATSWMISSLVLGFQNPWVTATGSYGTWTVAKVAAGSTFSSLLVDLLYIAITFFISAAIRSQILAVGVGIGSIVVSSVINSFVIQIAQNWPQFNWLKWTLFNLFNLNKRFLVSGSGAPLADVDLAYWQMIYGIGVYTLIIYLATDWLFCRRDVTNS